MIAKLLLLGVLQGPLDVMSYNIRYDNPNDGPDAWPNRRADMVAYLRSRASDVIGLQEVLRRQLDDLMAGLPEYGVIGVGRDDGQTRGEYAPILYRRDRFRVVESSTFWFSDTPRVPGSRSWGNTVTRICTWARLEDVGDGAHYVVYNVHLDHQSQPSRERSVAALLDTIRSRVRGNVIVTGDFNAGPGNPAVRAMVDAGLRDSYGSLDSLDGTFNGFRDDTTGAKIDFIFLGERLRPAQSRIDRPRTSRGRNLSDHDAVIVTILEPDVVPHRER